MLDKIKKYTYYVLRGVKMKNITLAMDEEIIVLGREYAKRHNLSFNALVRKSLEKTVRHGNKNWLDEMFKDIDKENANSKEKSGQGKSYINTNTAGILYCLHN